MHLSDELLNEYLDQALTPQARDEAVRHLAACADCAARLAALQALFADIESLPEVALSRSLAAPVTRLLRGRRALPRWIRLTAVLESALAAAAVLLAAPVLSEFLASLSTQYEWPSVAEMLLQFQVEWTAWLATLPEFTLPELPTLSLEVSSLALTLTGLAAFLMWVVGNGLLLRRMKSSR